jgi:hypothetical protein
MQEQGGQEAPGMREQAGTSESSNLAIDSSFSLVISIIFFQLS